MSPETSSRIIVKNLPKHVTEVRLKEIFGQKGELTDVRMMKSQDGIFRKFAFIGFKTEGEAKSAAYYFNNTYLDTSKITVQLSKPYGDPSLPRPWSKYSRGSSAYTKRLKGGDIYAEQSGIIGIETNPRTLSELHDVNKKTFRDENDPKFKEFLELATPLTKTRLWTNEDGTLPSSKTKEKPEHIKFDDNGNIRIGSLENDELLQNKDESIVESDSSNQKTISDMSMKVSGHSDEPTMSLDEFSTRRQPSSMKSSSEEVSGLSTFDSSTHEAKNMSSDEVLLETGRLFVRNLSYLCTEEDLRKIFEPFGPLSEVHLPMSKDTQKFKGFAYVLYMIPEHAVKAYAELDGKIFQGRLLHLVAASPKRETEKIAHKASSASYKEALEKERRAASHSELSWNSLFIRSDTVAEAMAAKMNLGKSEILNSSTDNSAVLLALSESHIISETKKFLENEGVCLDAFSANMKKERSKTCILVKNIPFSTELADLKSIFGKFGDFNKLILPPSKSIGLVDFANPTQAKLAFKNLAYTKFKDVPLYLEWAPLKIFVNKPSDSRSKQESSVTSNIAAQELDSKIEQPTKDTIEEAHNDVGNRKVIFVKNINFSTTDETFKRTFEAVDEIRYATIVKKPNTKQPGHMLSTGYGFVEYKTHESALKAMKTLQNVNVDGHAWSLKFSDRGVESAKTSSATSNPIKAHGTKLLIRNVPFEASKKELRELLSTFGQIKAMRLPKKLTGEHRGFCFVDFLTEQEAKHAFESLTNIHFYGRHLVIEWAEDDESLSSLREKTTKRFLIQETRKPQENQSQLGRAHLQRS